MVDILPYYVCVCAMQGKDQHAEIVYVSTPTYNREIAFSKRAILSFIKHVKK